MPLRPGSEKGKLPWEVSAGSCGAQAPDKLTEAFLSVSLQQLWKFKTLWKQSWQSLLHSFSFCVHSPKVAFSREATLSLVWQLPFTPLPLQPLTIRIICTYFMFYKNIRLIHLIRIYYFKALNMTANGVHALKRKCNSLIEFCNTSDENLSYGLNVTAMIDFK